MRNATLATASARLLFLCAEDVRARERIGGEPGHRGARNENEAWQARGPTPEPRAAHRKSMCEAERARMTRKAGNWNRRHTAAWAKLQETCADNRPNGRNACLNERRRYRTNHSPAAAAESHKRMRSRVSEACDPPKSLEEVRCKQLASAASTI